MVAGVAIVQERDFRDAIGTERTIVPNAIVSPGNKPPTGFRAAA
ncbi:hypothetical protein USDA257_c56430 [Sinorhizobium fredii USDA 257]|uniref:Uncharacterized protein n=1 Tax=Sinorhizobium fredii (strain USDA 257) TaxID=1185652 RepID=I3XE51_SINF2|nr:hypothetical protein USDA257_c56430 [Sinorhizobium fredii USDA 257]